MPNCRVAFGRNPDGGCARLSGVTISLRKLDQLGLSRYPKRGSDTQCRLLVSSRLQPWRGYEGFVAPAARCGNPGNSGWHHRTHHVSLIIVDSGMRTHSIAFGTQLDRLPEFETGAKEDRLMAKETAASGLGKANDPGHVPTQDIMTTSDASDVIAEHRDEMASKMVNRFAIWSGAAGLVPLPLLDVAAVGGIQLQMLRRLSQVYDVPFSQNKGKSIIASLAGSAIPASSGMGVASALKMWPGIGTAVSALTMPALSAAATYAIGKAFIEHFKSGGTFLDFNPPDYHEFIKSQRELFRWKPAAEPAGNKPGSSPAAARATTET
jgi:uncharacterized protein (DUF697 family)